MSADDQQSANQYESPRTESTVTTDSRPATKLVDRPLAILLTAAGSTVAFFGTCLPGGVFGVPVYQSFGGRLGPHNQPTNRYLLWVTGISLITAIAVGIVVWRLQPRKSASSEKPK